MPVPTVGSRNRSGRGSDSRAPSASDGTANNCARYGTTRGAALCVSVPQGHQYRKTNHKQRNPTFFHFYASCFTVRSTIALPFHATAQLSGRRASALVQNLIARTDASRLLPTDNTMRFSKQLSRIVTARITGAVSTRSFPALSTIEKRTSRRCASPRSAKSLCNVEAAHVSSKVPR